VDSFLHIYRISLGDFDTDRYTAHPAAKWIWIYFFLATLLTQVMFLNMLIAIMGDTFSRVNNQKDVNALKERTLGYLLTLTPGTATQSHAHSFTRIS